MRARSGEQADFAIRDLSAGGARIVGQLRLVEGERIRVVLDLDDVVLSVAAEVVRTEPQNAQAAIAFRDLPRDALDLIARSVEASIERVRSASPPSVVVFGGPAETRAALERDLAQLGRAARPCGTMLEAIWSLQEPAARLEAIIIAGDVHPEPLGELLQHLAEHHPRLRRLLLFGDQLQSVDHGASSRIDAVLRTPLRIRALARALGLGRTDSSLGMLPLPPETEPQE